MGTIRYLPIRLIQANLIKDDNDQYWVYGGRKIRCVGDDSPDSGYYCEDFFHGINELIGFGYIDGDEVLQTRQSGELIRYTAYLQRRESNVSSRKLAQRNE